MAGKPFASITDLLEDLLGSHIDKEMLQKILQDADQTLGIVREFQTQAFSAVLSSLSRIEGAQQAMKTVQDGMVADLLSIKAFLGVPDVRLGATQEELNALGARIQETKHKVTQFDENIPKTD